MIHSARKHIDGVREYGLPDDRAYVPAGMFFGWAITSGLANEEELAGVSDLLERFAARQISGARVFEMLSGTLDDELLSEAGYAFAEAYVGWNPGQYFEDYRLLLGADVPSIWHVEDTWDTFDRLRPRVDERFREWSA